jgi:uncharacterized protein YcnI
VAAAHVTLAPPEWEAGGFARFVVRVPNERDNAATTKVTVRFPEQVIEARFQPIEGWDREIEMTQLDQPIEEEGEEPITEKIDTVTWSGGRIQPGEFQEFGVSFQVPEAEPGTMLAFPSIQTYSNGEVVRWIGPEESDEPAPLVEVLKGPGRGRGGGGDARRDARCRRRRRSRRAGGGERRQRHAVDHRADRRRHRPDHRPRRADAARGRPDRARSRPPGDEGGSRDQLTPIRARVRHVVAHARRGRRDWR